MSNSIAKNSPYRWPALFVLTGAGICAMRLVRFPAAPMLGSMIAGILVAMRTDGLKLPPRLFLFGQGIVGLMIGLRIPRDFLSELYRSWPLFLGGVAWAILAAAFLGWLLTRWRVFPGTTAVWGLSPGAATSMTVMSEEYGGDIRLVAFMQYFRIVCVVVATSIAALIWKGDPPASGAAAAGEGWLAWPDWQGLLLALAVILAALAAGARLRLPGGGILGPMAAGILFNFSEAARLDTPWWLVSFGSMLIGWSIGLRFNRDALRKIAHALPSVGFAIAGLIALCGGYGAVMARCAGIDPLTAYLATSPGGLDSISLIAASTDVDMSFVLAMHTARFLLVLLTGPWLAKKIVRQVNRRREKA